MSMNIPMPDKQEKEQAITHILDTACIKKQSLFGFLLQFYRDVGLVNLFHGVADIIFLSIPCAVFLILALFSFGLINFYGLLFLLSPLIYVMLHSVGLWMEQQNRTMLELKMVCKYTARHIISFRMLLFSMAGLIGNFLLFTFVFSMEKATGEPIVFMEFVRLFLLSCSGLFLYAILSIVLLKYAKRQIFQSILPISWGLITIVVSSIEVSRIEQFLFNIPVLLLVGLLVGSFVIYIGQLKQFCIKIEEASGYAKG